MNTLTIYSRILQLKYKSKHWHMSIIGLQVRNKYKSNYGKMPDKQMIDIKGVNMKVFVYPFEFIPAMDEIIHSYYQNLLKLPKKDEKQNVQGATPQPQAATPKEQEQVIIMQAPVEPEAVKESGKRIRQRMKVKALPVRPTIKK